MKTTTPTPEYTTIRIRTETRQTLERIEAMLMLKNGEKVDAAKAAEYAAKLAEEQLSKDKKG